LPLSKKYLQRNTSRAKMGGELRVRKVQIVIGLAVIVGLTLGVVITILYCTLAESDSGPTKVKAKCLLSKDGGTQRIGTVELEQTGDGPVTLKGQIDGLKAGDHGFHIHEFGDITTCGDAGGHYNPDKANHGAPGNSKGKRHVGDLGNIQAENGKEASIDITDSIISLWGERSIIGRAIVVHEDIDDLGLGGDEGSITTGNAGIRVACGVIGIVEIE